MTLRSWLLALPAMFAIGCAAEPSGPSQESTEQPVVSNIGNIDGLREPSPEDTTSPAAQARGGDDVVDQARADLLVGEEASGYLGLVTDRDLIDGKAAPSDLADRVQTLNAKRRELYTKLSLENGVSVEDAAQTTACVLIREKVKIGEAYRTDSPDWKVRTFDVPVVRPSFCQ